jgi:hypothetical protein
MGGLRRKSMNKLMGWKKDKYDPRDWIIRRLPPEVIPDSYSLVEYLPDVRDQGNVGSCVGFGIGGNLTGTAKQCGVYQDWFSPTWIYNGARFIAGDLPFDVGAYPKDALEWLIDKGCLPEHFWPYNPNRLDKTSPPSSLDPEAAKWPLLAYFRITGGAEGICSAIASGHLVSIGVPWFDKWMDPTNGQLPEVTNQDDLAGGHEVFLYGYSKPLAIFYGMNSWGKEWGNNGKFTMPLSAFDVFKELGGYDAHFLAVTWEEQTDPIDPPEPTPSPTPKKHWWVILWEWIKKILGL